MMKHGRDLLAVCPSITILQMVLTPTLEETAHSNDRNTVSVKIDFIKLAIFLGAVQKLVKQKLVNF